MLTCAVYALQHVPYQVLMKRITLVSLGDKREAVISCRFSPLTAHEGMKN